MPARTSAFIPLVVAAALLALPSSASAKGKKKKKAALPKPACGISYLPLVEGAEWVYEAMPSPEQITEEDQAQLNKWRWVSPPSPAKIVIKVEKVQAAKGGATITLLETVDGRARKTNLTCTKTGLQIDPQSFFFAIEPGGALLMELTDLKRQGGMPGFKGWKKAGKLVTTVTANLTRAATEGTNAKVTGGTLEIERTIHPASFVSVSTPTGKHLRAARVEFDLAGRVAIEPKLEKRIEIPLRWRGYMWFKDGVGLVQARNRIGHWFQLTQYNF